MKYRYSGPMTAATLDLGEGGTMDVVLIDDAVIDLPEGNPYVATLVARGQLVAAAPVSANPATPATKEG